MGEYDTGPNIFFNDDLYFGSNDSESLHGFPIILDQPGDGMYLLAPPARVR